MDVYNDLLLHEIAHGESKILEFKRELPKGIQIAKTLVAFANSSGGKLIIGVDDDRTIVGIQEDIFLLQDKISSIINDLCQPQLTAQVYIKNINNKELLIIEVARGGLVPYYIKTVGKKEGTYFRLGASNRLAAPDYIQQLELQHLNLSFDELPNLQYPLENLDIGAVEQAFKLANKQLTQEKMLNLKLVKKEYDELYATNGLLILLGIYEHASTQCARFKGTNMNVFLDRKEYQGDIFSQLEKTELFIKNHLSLRAEIKGLVRHDYLEIPEGVIREALINAYIHRDYSNYGRNIKVAVYDHAVSIVSSGGLPNGLLQSQIHQGRSEIRNRVLARVFKELGYVEHWGSGIQRMKQMCFEEGLREPDFLETDNFFEVKLYRQGIRQHEQGQEGQIKEPVSAQTTYRESGQISCSEEKQDPEWRLLTKRQQEVLLLLQGNPAMSRQMLAAELGINPSAVQKHTDNLKKLGAIERIGGTRGYWLIKWRF